jgi:hypothetical protein
MAPVTGKSSTILISVGAKTTVYRSVEEVPPTLRKKLEETTSGANAKTILIADRKGRQELIRSLQGLPSGVPLPADGRRGGPCGAGVPQSAPNWALRNRHWLEIAGLGVLGLLIWLLFIYK